MSRNAGVEFLKGRKKPIRLRDFIRVKNYYFSVVGYQNKRDVKCFLRYIPDKRGDRVRTDGERFRKLLHKEAIDYARKNSLEYFNGKIFVVPQKDVTEVFKPEEKVISIKKEINETLEYDKPGSIKEDVCSIKENNKNGSENLSKIISFFSNIPEKEMGITGSRLIGLEKENSDVDFIIYGKWWREGRAKIISGIKRGKISEPDTDMWNFIYKKRKVNIPYQIFLSHEKRKYHRAVFEDTYFDLLYVRGYSELYKGASEEEGIKKGKKTVSAVLKDDNLTFDYPSFYPLRHNNIEAVLSFTHTYAGQAILGEEIEARGVIEEIQGKKYLIVGTQREVEDEYIVSIDHMEKEGLIQDFIDWKKG